MHEIDVLPQSNEIVVGDATQRLKPRQMEVLQRLAADPGAVVTRETLLHDVWPRRMVNDEVLSRVIADLRAALGDDAREARFIETIPKVGYRLIAPVTPWTPRPGETESEGEVLVSRSRTAEAKPPAPPRRWPWWAAAVFAGGLAWLLLRAPTPESGLADRATLERQLAQAEPFSSGVELEVGARFSPDGRRVAFAAGEGETTVIHIQRVGAAERVTLGDPADLNLNPVFFADGASLAYFSRGRDGRCGIVAQDLAGGTVRPLIDCARSPRAQFDLSPDGRHLVYAALTRPQFPASLLLREIATGVERPLTTPEPGDGDDLMPRFSPDGARVLFFRGTRSHRQAWLVDLKPGAVARSPGSPRGLVYGGAWLGPAGPVVVAADWYGQRSLNLLDVDTGVAAPLGARGARFPDVDRAGNIVFENAVYSANLYRVDPAAPAVAPQALWSSTRYTNQAEFSPDGTRVVFASNRDGASGLYVAALEGAATRLALEEGYLYMRPHWSMDGHSIYATRVGRREGNTPLQQGIRVTLVDGAVEVLSAYGDAVVDVRETDRSGARIVGELAGNATRLLRSRPGASTERLPLPLVGEYQVRGDRLAYSQPDLPGLTLCALSTMRCAPLPLAIDEGNRFDWLLTDDAVWYRAGTRPDALVRFDLASGRETWRSAFAPTALGLSIAVAPDGKTVLVAREAPVVIDLFYASRVSR